MKKILKISLIVILCVSISVTLFGVIYISNIMNETKNIEFDKNKIISATKTLNLYDNNEEKLNINSADNSKVQLSELSDDTINCFLSIEDKKFYSHHGLNYNRMAKALFNNIKSKSIKEGASTISQQLIKNTHLNNEKTIKRKLKEIMLTKKLEKTFSKDEILETYLNVIYFGDGCYGIEDASNHYFGKSAKDLSLTESATLAGLIKAPSTYSPTNNYDKSLERRNVVLKSLFNDGYITDEEYYKISQEPIELNINEKQSNMYFENVKTEAEEILKIPAQQIMLNNYKIYTYFDTAKQSALENTLNDKSFYHQNKNGNVADGLGIVIDCETAGISAIYGNSQYNLNNLKRQPGSAIKPIMVYAPALDTGEIYNCSEILDEKIDFDGYSPNNVGNHYYGYISVKDAVAKSLNVPAVKLMNQLGIEKCKSFCKKAGIEFSNSDNGYALALGGFTDGITLKSLTNSYIPFANSGKYIEAKFIKKITTESGVIIYENNQKETQIMHEDTAYLVTDLLKCGVEYGTSSRLNKLDFEIAGKTGTVAVKNSNENSDVYSIAYTSKDIVGVWLGNYTMDPSYNLENENNGGTYCTSMVKDIFENIYSTPPKKFHKPDGIISLKIDEKNLTENHTVKLADESCPKRYTRVETFSSRFAPTEISDIYTNFDCEYTVDYNSETNIININITPKDYLIYNIYCNNELIETIENKGEEQIVTIESLQPNSVYNIKIDVKNAFNDIVKTAPSKSIYTKNTFSSLIENDFLDGNLKWLFT